MKNVGNRKKFQSENSGSEDENRVEVEAREWRRLAE